MSDASPSRSSINPPSSNEDWLEVGKIIGAHGLNGEVKVFPDSDFPERFTKPGLRWLRFPTRPLQIEEINLKKGRFIEQKGIYIVQLADVNFRDQAELLKGAELLVRSCDRPSLADGEYYLSDLIGVTVIDQTKRTIIGSVVRIASAGNDLLDIQLLDSDQTVLVPFVPAIVPIVDIENQTIEILPPTGLIPE
ncbi:ribosome maturation factor RimM [Acaryochloris sp. IP29b_bin.137]|uniref:ribosome maturation factor RimM n=1 Tax=Acaryochloris sp. IP29b_bin.137 TaxID=2969217 RepID=UPI00260B5401|nr:ribosome maturation factor RimM [Acaryochloris sp. IP29b_bin.137]